MQVIAISKVSKTRDGKFVVLFKEEVGGTVRIVMSKKQYANMVEPLGISKGALAPSMILLQGARADVQVESRKKGDEYTDAEGKKLKYTKDHNVVTIENITLPKSSKAVMMDIAKEAIIRASVEDEFESEDEFDDSPQQAIE